MAVKCCWCILNYGKEGHQRNQTEIRNYILCGYTRIALADISKNNETWKKGMVYKPFKWEHGGCTYRHYSIQFSERVENQVFAGVDEMILCLYYLYKKSPKKLYQLTRRVVLNSWSKWWI